MELMSKEEIKNYARTEFNIFIENYNGASAQIFKMEYGESKNFMTPETVGYGFINIDRYIVYELSRGTDLDNKLIYGVTVTDGKERFYNDSMGMFYSVENALEHIQHLIEKYGDKKAGN